MRPILTLFTLLTGVVLVNCQSNSGGTVTPDEMTAEDRVESSVDPNVFLAGNYIIDAEPNAAPIIEVRRPAKISGPTTGVVSYTLTIAARGDSVNLVLAGRGVAGTYTNYNLGNYGIVPSGSNPTGKPTYNNAGEAIGDARYEYKLTKATDVEAIKIIRDLSKRRNTIYSLSLSLFPDDNVTPTLRWRAYKKEFEVRLDYAWSATLKRKTSGYWR